MFSLPRPDNGLTLYHQIAVILRTQIERGEWASGDRMPSENRLASDYRVSVMTVRRAFEVLVKEGLVERKRGRGSFIAMQTPSDLENEVTLGAALEDVHASVADLQVRLLDITRVRGPLKVIATLGESAGAEVIRVRRVRLAHGAPIAFSLGFVPLWLAPELKSYTEAQPYITQHLEAQCGREFKSAAQTISATVADAEAAEVTNVPIGYPLLLVERNYQFEDGRVGYMAVNRYPSNLFRYRMNLHREGAVFPEWAGVEVDTS